MNEVCLFHDETFEVENLPEFPEPFDKIFAVNSIFFGKSRLND